MSRPRVARWVAGWLVMVAAVFGAILLVAGGDADRYPVAPAGVGGSADVGPPPDDHGLPTDLVERLLAATVRIRGLDCMRAQVGSGFLIDGGLVVTSAHVVAGIASPVVTTGMGEMATRVVGFDPVADLAVLEPVDDRALPAPIELGEAVAGSVGAILVHDEDGPRAVPMGIHRRIRATGADVYGRPASGRDALVLAASVETGHSGAAVVDGDGRVVGITFSRVRGGRPVAYAVQSGALRSLLERILVAPEEAGPCVDGR